MCFARGSVCIQQGARDEADAVAAATAAQGTRHLHRGLHSHRPRPNQINIPPGVHSPDEGHNGTTDQSGVVTDTDQDSDNKSASICTALHAALPRYDSLISKLLNSGAWWYQYCQRTYPVGCVPAESLVEFAQRMYFCNNPARLAMLVIVYARSSDNNGELYSLVDRLVLSDLAYLNTLDGGECIIYLAEAYSAIGELKKAWLLWRKGVSVIQIMVRAASGLVQN